MELAKLVLVIVIVGRPENDPAHTTLSDKRVLAFRRLGRGAFGLIESAKMFSEDVADSFVLGKPQRVVQSANE